MTDTRIPKELLTFFLILLTAFGLFFFRLGERSLRNPDEGRYATIAWEMTESGDWVRPTICGIPYLRKPILFYWLVAGSFKLFGYNEWAGRAVPAIFGILGILATFYFSRIFFGRRTAIFSALVLLSNCWYVQVGRYLVIDMVFAFFVSASLYFFYLSVNTVNTKKIYALCFYLCIGLSFLAKGILGFVLPGLSIIIYLLISRKLIHTLRTMHLGLGALVCTAVVGPWLFLITRRDNRFWEIFFFREHWQRMVARSFEHQEPWYFYLVMCFALFLPWSLLWAPLRKSLADHNDPKVRDAKCFLLTSVISMIAFLSLSKSKMPTYLLPAMPFLSILIGDGWRRWVEGRAISRSARVWTKIVLLTLLSLAIVFLAVWPRLFASWGIAIVPELEKNLRLLAGAIIVGSVLGYRVFARQDTGKLFLSQVFMLCLVSGIATYAMETLNRFYTTKPFAQALRARAEKTQDVYLYDHPGAFYDFEFYFGSPVRLVGLQGELEGWEPRQSDRAYFIDRSSFLRKLQANEKFFCLIRKSDFLEIDPEMRSKLLIIKQDSRKILFESGPA